MEETQEEIRAVLVPIEAGVDFVVIIVVMIFLY